MFLFTVLVCIFGNCFVVHINGKLYTLFFPYLGAIFSCAISSPGCDKNVVIVS